MEEKQEVTSNVSPYEQYLETERRKRIPKALENPNEDEDLKQARLEQLHELARNSRDVHEINQAQQERDTFLSSAGPFDPLVMSKSFGFEYEDKSIFPVDNGQRIARLRKGNTAITLMKDKSFGDNQLYVRTGPADEGRQFAVNAFYQPKPDAAKQSEGRIVDMPTTVEAFYELMHSLSQGFNFHPKDKSAYEINYIKNKKAKK